MQTHNQEENDEKGKIMLLKTYQKTMNLFAEYRGYMGFADLQSYQITISQIHELESEGIIEKFARGWYWCRECGLIKAKDSKFIEIAKVNPNAVICMESACYLNGLLENEPPVVTVATERTDRRKMEFVFPVRRYYLQNTNISGEICRRETDFGDYRYYSTERTLCDCLRLRNNLDDGIYMEIVEIYRKRKEQQERVREYAKALRALRNVEEAGR